MKPDFFFFYVNEIETGKSLFGKEAS